MIELIKQLLTSLTVVGLLIMLGFYMVSLASFFVKKDLMEKKPFTELTKLMRKHGLWYAFIVAAIAMSGSLFYSDIVGWEPCKLCWYQRIAIYPMVVLFGIAAWKNDRQIGRYVRPLLLIGGAIAFYQYLSQQFTFIDPTTCGALSVSCSDTYVRTFGFITIPLKAFTACLLMWMFLGFAEEKRFRGLLFWKK